MRWLPALFLQLLVVAAFRCCAYALRAALNTRLLDGRKRNDSTPELRREAYRCNLWAWPRKKRTSLGSGSSGSNPGASIESLRAARALQRLELALGSRLRVCLGSSWQEFWLWHAASCPACTPLVIRIVARAQGHILVLAQPRTRTRGSHTFVKQPRHYAD